MPQRPRSHQLETESINAFERLIPSSWIVRRVNDADYGIDLEVEAFEGEATTGYTFKVQLKSTDKPAKRGGYSLTLASATFAYWKSLDVPVLVVFYSAPEGNLYMRWAHSFDPYKANHGKPSTAAKRPSSVARTIQFKFEKRHIVKTFAPEIIIRELKAIRAFVRRGADYPLPINFNIQYDGKHVRSRVSALLHRAVKNSAYRLILGSDDIESLQVEVHDDRIRVSLPTELGSHTVHFPKGDLDSRPIGHLVADVMVVIACMLLRMAHSPNSLRLLLDYADDSSICRTPAYIEWLVDDFVQSGLKSEACAIVALFPEESNDDFQLKRLIAMFMFNMPGPSNLRRQDHDWYLEFEQRLMRNFVDRGAPEQAGSVAYSVGQMYRSRKDMAAALEHYDLAIELDGRYGSRGYFYRERAGIKFEMDDLVGAERDYRRAAELGVPEATYLLADTLYWRGKYKESLNTVKATPDDIHASYAPGVLSLERVLAAVVGVTGLDEQQRIRDESLDIESLDNVDMVVAALCCTDALDTRLWHAYARLVRDFISLEVLANLVETDPVLWITFMAEAFQTEQSIEFKNLYWDKARRFSDADLVEGIEAVVAKMDSDGFEVPSAVRDLLDFAFERAAVPVPYPPRVVRFVGGDSDEVLEVVLRDDWE